MNMQEAPRMQEERRPSRARRSRTFVAAALASAVVTVGGIAMAAIPDATGVFHACVANTGNVRIVESSSDCRANETAVNWNQAGPMGPQGPAGPPGPAGPTNLITRTSAPVDVPPVGPIVRDARVNCLAGERATGGGALNSGPAPAFFNTVLLSSFPTANGAPAENGQVADGWFARARNNGEGGQVMRLIAYVICAS
jgi:hypothetical protein